jgi:hypothetical protein
MRNERKLSTPRRYLNMKRNTTFALLAAAMAVATSLPAADYPCWRGADGSGTSESEVVIDFTVAGKQPLWVSADPIPAAVPAMTLTGPEQMENLP